MKNLIFILCLFVLAACGSNADTQEQTTATAPPAKQVKAPPAKTQGKPANFKEGAGKVNWVSLEEAQKLTKKTPKKLIVDVYTPWCGPCKMMDRFTFSDEKVAEHFNDNYYAVKFNGESGDAVNFAGRKFENPNFNPNTPPNRRNAAHQITGAFGIRGYPTLIILDPELKKLKDIVGYRTPDQLMAELGTL